MTPTLTGSHRSRQCPYAAGVAALILNANGKVKPATLLTMLQSTARPVPVEVGGSALETVSHQGAGLIDAYAA